MYFGIPYLYSRISEGVRAMFSFINGKGSMLLQNDDGKEKKFYALLTLYWSNSSVALEYLELYWQVLVMIHTSSRSWFPVGKTYCIPSFFFTRITSGMVTQNVAHHVAASDTLDWL